MTGFYREQLIGYEFTMRYLEAVKGKVEAIREVARRFREGHGVAVCEAAAVVWESRLMKA